MENEERISFQWHVVGRQWEHHLKGSGRFWGTTGRRLKRQWRHTRGTHRLTSNHYSLQYL